MQFLTLEQKIGQLFFIGIPGTEIDAETDKLLEKIAPGGVCLFSRNIRQAEQTRKLLTNISEKLPVQPILSIDQEGGLVDRLRRVVTPMPSAHNLTTKGTVEEVKELAQITAEIISILGFNMNFAPVVDVVDETREKFSNGLHSRAFGKSVDDVIEFAGAYLEQLQSKNCPGSLKHFPGLGATEVDSHDELPSVNIDNERLYNTDLKPYKEFIEKNSAQSIMVGHAAYPHTDLQERDANGKLLPASLNHKIITKLLREKLGFDKLVVTDDLEMGAILKNYGIGEACAMAIEAGNDMLLICASQTTIDEGYDFMMEAVRAGRISETRIDESLVRISEFKKLLQPPPAFDETRLAELSKRIEQLNAKLT
jgi:beta-N-acetylhexosaminidase